MDTPGVDRLLLEMRMASKAAQSGGSASEQLEGPQGGASFQDVLNDALRDVSKAQQEAQSMSQDFVKGDPNVNLQDVMVNLQKANLSFQQMVQVRNRLVTAYQDIMNMPV